MIPYQRGVKPMNLMEKINLQKIKIAGLLITVGVLGSILLHDLFNSIGNPMSTNGFPLDVFFVIAAVSLFAGMLLGKYYALFVPLCVIAISDVFRVIVDPTTAMYWTTSLFLFTWSGYAIIALLGSVIKRKDTRTRSFVPLLMGAGVLGVIIYDLWTNFGFWLGYSKLGFYPQTLGGLSTVFIAGIPSTVWHLLSTSIAIACVAVPLLYLRKQELLSKNLTIKPIEKYVVISATVVLMSASILSTLV